MNRIKRTLVLSLAFALVQSFVFAQSVDEKAVAATVEKLKSALLSANEAELNDLTSPLLSYGHSNGLIEDKKEFIRALTSQESKFTKIELADQTIAVSGDLAMVRHKLFGDTHNKGKDPAQIKLGVILVFQKTKGSWKLIGRQGFKLP